jgi:hypothetical protein
MRSNAFLQFTGVTIMAESAGAVFDQSGKYRYRLWRRWNAAQPLLCIIMHNPISAEEIKKDPTIDRCAALAQHWGYGGIEIVNLFAYCATRQRDLWQAEDPCGPHNDQHIRRVVDRCKACLVAWGDLPPGRMERIKTVLDIVEGKQLYCLGLTKHKQPRHPLTMVNLAGDNANIELMQYAPPFREAIAARPQ